MGLPVTSSFGISDTTKRCVCSVRTMGRWEWEWYGGTREILTLNPSQTNGFTPFMGVWSPEVHSFSSNWKELKTILVSLQTSAQDHLSSVQEKLILYFTDNMVSYDIIRKRRSRVPKLHQLVCEISALEVSLDCILVCIHVPGSTMILQGTDGLSRGVTLSRFNMPPPDLYARLFSPLPATRLIIEWAISKTATTHSQISDWGVAADLSPWEKDLKEHNKIIWMISPQLCRQAMTAATLDWSSHPLDHEHIFVTPRLCQRSFG